jgi:inner membrane protein
MPPQQGNHFSMPSPIAHVAAGYLIWKSSRESLDERFSSLAGIATLAFLSLLPDADAIPGILLHDLGRFHNYFSHSLFSGLALSLALPLAARALGRPRPFLWLKYGLACYWLHLAMDFMTIGRGVMLFWPLSSSRFSSPVKLFTGLHWSAGLWSTRHLETVLTEGLLILSALLLYTALGKRSILRTKSREKA